MQIIEISLEYRVIAGISGMVLLFASFLVVFVISHRRKLQYHKDLNALNEERRQILIRQNIILENKVEARTTELVFQKNELQKSLQELNMAQMQLIQKERMASLGEVTAGIAHEMQNPLNFVNNFSEVTMELIEELKVEIRKRDIDEAFLIADSIKESLEKINHHGKRAESIVKGMLEHARIDNGQKDLTDIGKLAAESLRLSYHSFCEKDRAFNALCETHADPGIPDIQIIPQTVRRVLFNLFNNAFYAVREKKKRLGESYRPVVSVTTRQKDVDIQLIIHDNGTGIPTDVQQKIFQPFFTTKPTGQGTGLGLSLSYEIIKAHGGEIKVDSVEGAYTSFTISLPVKK